MLQIVAGMEKLLLAIAPNMMARYQYVHDLLKWAAKSVEAIKSHSSTAGYPLIEPMLLCSLEKVAHEIGSVPLLRFTIKLTSLNEQLKNTNAHAEDTSVRIDTFFTLKDEVPRLDSEVKRALATYAAKSICLFIVLAVLIVSAVLSFSRCAG